MFKIAGDWTKLGRLKEDATDTALEQKACGTGQIYRRKVGFIQSELSQILCRHSNGFKMLHLALKPISHLFQHFHQNSMYSLKCTLCVKLMIILPFGPRRCPFPLWQLGKWQPPPRSQMVIENNVIQPSQATLTRLLAGPSVLHKLQVITQKQEISSFPGVICEVQLISLTAEQQ